VKSFFCWTFNFVYIVGGAMHKLKIPIKHLFTLVILHIIGNPRSCPSSSNHVISCPWNKIISWYVIHVYFCLLKQGHFLSQGHNLNNWNATYLSFFISSERTSSMRRSSLAFSRSNSSISFFSFDRPYIHIMTLDCQKGLSAYIFLKNDSPFWQSIVKLISE